MSAWIWYPILVLHCSMTLSQSRVAQCRAAASQNERPVLGPDLWYLFFSFSLLLSSFLQVFWWIGLCKLPLEWMWKWYSLVLVWDQQSAWTSWAKEPVSVLCLSINQICFHYSISWSIITLWEMRGEMRRQERNVCISVALLMSPNMSHMYFWNDAFVDIWEVGSAAVNDCMARSHQTVG